MHINLPIPTSSISKNKNHPSPAWVGFLRVIQLVQSHAPNHVERIQSQKRFCWNNQIIYSMVQLFPPHPSSRFQPQPAAMTPDSTTHITVLGLNCMTFFNTWRDHNWKWHDVPLTQPMTRGKLVVVVVVELKRKTSESLVNEWASDFDPVTWRIKQINGKVNLNTILQMRGCFSWVFTTIELLWYQPSCQAFSGVPQDQRSLQSPANPLDVAPISKPESLSCCPFEYMHKYILHCTILQQILDNIDIQYTNTWNLIAPHCMILTFHIMVWWNWSINSNSGIFCVQSHDQPELPFACCCNHSLLLNQPWPCNCTIRSVPFSSTFSWLHTSSAFLEPSFSIRILATSGSREQKDCAGNRHVENGVHLEQIREPLPHPVRACHPVETHVN